MAAKQTHTLIPLCHPLALQHISVDLSLQSPDKVTSVASATVEANTGVEMEALTAVNVSLLTVYDMCKAMGKHMKIQEVALVSKTGGKSGDFHEQVILE